MDWYIQSYTGSPMMKPYVTARGHLLLRRARAADRAMLYVQVRVEGSAKNAQSKHKYWWSSQQSMRPPPGATVKEVNDMFKVLCDVLAARLGADYILDESGEKHL